MRGRAGLIGFGAAIVTLLGAGVALATFTSDVLYKPPLLRILDVPAHGTIENLAVGRSGDEIVIVNPGGAMSVDPDSDPGCAGSGSAEVHCPVAGIETLRITTNDLDDRAEVALRASANKVKQFISLGDGEDQGIGHTGKQRIRGGAGDDTLKGGPGPDFLDGGPGDDTCKGGPGRDTIERC